MNNRFLQGVLGLVACMLFVYLAMLTRNAALQYKYIGTVPHDRDTITVDGMGKISATPDLAQIDLGVQTEGATVKDIQTQNTQKMNAIIKAVKSLGVEEKDIQTSNYSISPKIDWSNGKQNVTGYIVAQNVTVKVRNLDKVGDVVSQAGTLGANQVGGIQFTIDDPTGLQAQARAKAIDDARKKAEALASQLGLTIVKVVTFSEVGNNRPVPMPMYASKDMMAAGEVAPVAPSIQSGSMDVMSNVNVTFQVN